MNCEIKVSIVTVCYNSVKTIDRAIKSVLCQTYSNIEYIIIDGGSLDGTKEVIQSYGGRISKFKSEPDKGIYDAMNKGLKMASGEIVGILNSDDKYHDEKVIEDIVNCYRKHPQSVIHGNLQYDDNINVRVEIPKNHIDKMKIGPVVLHPTMFVPKVLYDRIGFFSTRYRIASDYDLMLRIYLGGYNYEYINRIVTDMYAGGASDKYRLKGFYECYLVTLRAGLNPLSCTFNFVKRVVSSYL